MKTKGLAPLTWERMNKKGKRGVSPIIATILLVAITVVLAAVLYVLVSGYLSGTGSAPKTIQLSQPSSETQATLTSTCPATPIVNDYLVTFSNIQASGGLTPSSVGFKVVTPAGASVGLQAACVYGATGGAAVAIYTPTSATPWTGTGVSAAFPSGGYMTFDLGTLSLSGSGDTIQAFGLGGASVSGGYSAGL